MYDVAAHVPTSDITVMELAVKYGYDSPDSFTKAFTRFHGNSSSIVRRNKTMIKDFASLKLALSLKGGYTMDYRIAKKECLGSILIRKWEMSVLSI